MDTEKTETGTVTEETNGSEQEVETISVSKKDYETMNQTLGSLKRELKDLKKPKEESKTEPKPDDSALLQKLERMSLRQAGLTHQDDIDLARATAKKWGVDVDEVLLDEDFKIKLERQQTTRDNAIATSNIKSGSGSGQAKNTPEYWIAKGTPPSAADVPDRKTRATIARAMMKSAKGTDNPFYNGKK